MELFQYKQMYEKMDALERLELTVQWGSYDIHVLRFHLTEFPPGKVVNFHKHAEYEFHFIPGGRGKVIIQEDEYPLRAGLFYLTGPDVLHYQEAASNEAMEELCLHVDIVERDSIDITEDEVSSLNQWEWMEAKNCIEKLKQLPLFPAADLHDAMSYFVKAYEAAQNNYLGSYTTIRQAVIQILLRAARAYEKEDELQNFPTRDMKKYRYKLALEYIHTNYAQPLSIEDVADKLRVSTRQLQRLLKEMNQGKTFSTIVEDIRLAAVCKQLLTTQHSIEKIAGQSGFSSGNYLHTVFKNKFGLTPAQYRANVSNNQNIVIGAPAGQPKINHPSL